MKDRREWQAPAGRRRAATGSRRMARDRMRRPRASSAGHRRKVEDRMRRRLGAPGRSGRNRGGPSPAGARRGPRQPDGSRRPCRRRCGGRLAPRARRHPRRPLRARLPAARHSRTVRPKPKAASPMPSSISMTQAKAVPSGPNAGMGIADDEVAHAVADRRHPSRRRAIRHCRRAAPEGWRGRPPAAAWRVPA